MTTSPASAAWTPAAVRAAAVAVKEAGKVGKVKIVAMDRDEATLSSSRRASSTPRSPSAPTRCPTWRSRCSTTCATTGSSSSTTGRSFGVNPLPPNVDTGSFVITKDNVKVVLPQMMRPLAMDHDTERSQCSRLRGITQVVRRRPGPARRGPGRQRRRGARARRRERRGQEHAHEDRRRNSPARLRRHDDFHGRPVFRPKSPADALRAGIAMVHQELSLAPDLSVAENIFVGREPAGAASSIGRNSIARLGMAVEFCLAIDPGRPVSSLGIGYRQVVEILKALASQPEGHHLRRAHVVAGGARDGRSCWKRFASSPPGRSAWSTSPIAWTRSSRSPTDITVLRDGRLVLTRTYDAELTREAVVNAMVGRELAELVSRPGAVTETAPSCCAWRT